MQVPHIRIHDRVLIRLHLFSLKRRAAAGFGTMLLAFTSCSSCSSSAATFHHAPILRATCSAGLRLSGASA